MSGYFSQPAQTLRSLSESRRLLEEARQEIEENKERAQLRPSHTFSRLPGFFPRPAELQAVERTLEEEPCFTVLFGASSVGKVCVSLSPIHLTIIYDYYAPSSSRPPSFVNYCPLASITFFTSTSASLASRTWRVCISV